MIEVTLDIEEDGRVMLDGFSWTTVEADGFGVGAVDSVEDDLASAIEAVDGHPLVQATVPRQIMAVSNYLLENFQSISSRVTILRDGAESSRIDYIVATRSKPEPEPEPLPNRVSRYTRDPVI